MLPSSRFGHEKSRIIGKHILPPLRNEFRALKWECYFTSEAFLICLFLYGVLPGLRPDR